MSSSDENYHKHCTEWRQINFMSTFRYWLKSEALRFPIVWHFSSLLNSSTVLCSQTTDNNNKKSKIQINTSLQSQPTSTANQTINIQHSTRPRLARPTLPPIRKTTTKKKKETKVKSREKKKWSWLIKFYIRCLALCAVCVCDVSSSGIVIWKSFYKHSRSLALDFWFDAVILWDFVNKSFSFS